MIFFTLPNFYSNTKIINLFYNIHRNFPEYFKEDLVFSFATGNFTGCYWNGGYNNNNNKAALYEDFVKLVDLISIPIRFNCANIFLEKKDFFDTMSNTILFLNENGSNEIEISNLELYYFLKERYPNYNYIFSKEADLLCPLTENIINLICEKNFFRLIQIPENKALDIDFLKKIKQKNKIELPIISTCNIGCLNKNNCQLSEHKNQYNYSIKNNYKLCNHNKGCHKNNPLITIEDIKEKYLPLGINHFYFPDIISDKKDDLIVFLIDYFIKQEYKENIYKIYRRENML